MKIQNGEETRDLTLNLNCLDFANVNNNGMVWIPLDLSKDTDFKGFIDKVSESYANNEDEFGSMVDFSKTRSYIIVDCEGTIEAEFNIGVYCYPSVINQVDPELAQDWLNNPKNADGALTFPNDNGFYVKFDSNEKLAILTRLIGCGVLDVEKTPAR